MLSMIGCVAEPSDQMPEGEDVGGSRLLPSGAAEVDSPGPLVPGTRGSRVPFGYFTRARMSALDLYLPYTMGSFLMGKERAFLRLEALGEESQGERPTMHAFIPLAIVGSEGLATLPGLSLDKAALSGSQATIRLPTSSGSHTYLIELTRLSIDTLDDSRMTGSLQGHARRGTESQTTLRFEMGFVAYRGPNTVLAAPRTHPL
jgi:hypothetical protein